MTWNIRNGGGSRADAICQYLKSVSSNSSVSLSTIVLTEFRTGKTGTQIRSALEDYGFHHQAVPPTTSPKQNSVLVASKHPFRAQSFPELGDDQNRCIKAEFDQLTLYGLYFANNAEKIPLYRFLCALDPGILDQKALLIGDFNTGMNGADNEGANFVATQYLEELFSQGWIDTWRSRHPEAREFTWYSRKGGQPLNGFRIDQALATPKLDLEIKSAQYLHEVREGTAPLSDHSAMVVEL
jgi:exonuclease III